MKFLRFRNQYGEECCGRIADNGIHRIYCNFYDKYIDSEIIYQEKDITYLPPVKPTKIIAVGLNYYDHIKEFGNRDVPENPTLFTKFPHTVIAHTDAIQSHPASQRIDFEGELGLVIGKPCKNVTESEAPDYIFGATIVNDVTARDLQRADGQWTRGKNLETFCPMGPYVVTGLDLENLHIQSRLNGKIMQDSSTALMMNKPAKLVSFISQFIPLEQGDVISTGTPNGVGPMVRGDIIEIEIEGIGTLINIMK